MQKELLCNRHVRLPPKSGHVQRTTPCLLWAKSGHSSAMLECPLTADSDLTHQPHDVVEQVFLDDLSILPTSNSAELNFE